VKVSSYKSIQSKNSLKSKIHGYRLKKLGN